MDALDRATRTAGAPTEAQILQVLRDRLRATVEIKREAGNWEDRSAYQCEVTLVLLAEPSEFRDQDIGKADEVISTATTNLRIPT